MLIRSLLILVVTVGFTGILHAQEVAGDDALAVETQPLTCAADSPCLAGCGSRCGSDNGLRVEGWLNAGFMLNGNEPDSGFHGPYNQVDRHEGGLDQAYLILEKPLSCGPCMSIGGRVDFLYGTDAFLAESRGFEREANGDTHWNDDEYGLAIPQAYAEIGNNSLSLKVGHFYTIVGYEGVPAVADFFYSKSLSYMFGGPFVQWGGLASWKVNRCVSIDAGIVNGWDALDRVSDGAAFLGRISMGSEEDRLWTSFAIITGDERNEIDTESTNRTRYSFIVGTNLNCRLQYVFHHWYGVQEDFSADGDTAEWYGIDQYLYYRLSPCVRLGARFEWFRDDDGARLGLSRPSNPNDGPYVGDMYSLSLGVNWTPRCNLILRPEVRWDWFSGTGSPFDDGAADDQFLVGMDAIWRF